MDIGHLQTIGGIGKGEIDPANQHPLDLLCSLLLIILLVDQCPLLTDNYFMEKLADGTMHKET